MEFEIKAVANGYVVKATHTDTKYTNQIPYGTIMVFLTLKEAFEYLTSSLED